MKIELFHVKIPLKKAFSHAITSRTSSDSVVLRMRYKGIEAVGECAPRPYVTGETIDSVFEVVSKVNFKKIFYKINFSSEKTAIISVKQLSFFKNNLESLSATCLVEMAILDYIGKYFKCSLQELLTKHVLPRNVRLRKKKTFAFTSQVMDFSFSPPGFLSGRFPFHVVKIKLSKNRKNNIDRVKFIRKSLGKYIPIIADANMSWDLDFAIDMMKALRPYKITYFEEPLAKKNYLAYHSLKKESCARILLDESVCSFEDGKKSIQAGVVDAFNIRLSKCGGLMRSIELIKLAKENGIRFQLGAQVAEVGPLIAAARHLAFSINDYFAYEGGQADFQFNEFIVDPMPLVDRTLNSASPIQGYGLGVDLNDNVYKYAKKIIRLSYSFSLDSGVEKHVA